MNDIAVVAEISSEANYDDIDLIPVKDLWKEYGVGKTLFYKNLGDLKISPVTYGNRSFLSGEQKALLDKYYRSPVHKRDALVHELLGTGCEQSENVYEQTEQSTSPVVYSQRSVPTTLLRLPDELVQLLQQFLEQSETPRHPLENHRILLEAARDGFVLPTSQLLPLLGRKTIPKLDDHNRFHSMGFTFWKALKEGNQYGWRVTKQQV